MDHPQKRTTIIPKHKTSKPISKQTSTSGEKTSLFVVQHMAHNIFPGDEIAEKGIHEMWRFGPNHPWINRAFHYKPSIFGYHYFWKHPCTTPSPPRKLTWLKLKWNKTTVWVDVSPEWRMEIFNDVILVVGGVRYTYVSYNIPMIPHPRCQWKVTALKHLKSFGWCCLHLPIISPFS